jgi:hypothetical protein
MKLAQRIQGIRLQNELQAERTTPYVAAISAI